MQIGTFHKAQQTSKILTRTHGAALHADVLEEQTGQLSAG